MPYFSAELVTFSLLFCDERVLKFKVETRDAFLSPYF